MNILYIYLDVFLLNTFENKINIKKSVLQLGELLSNYVNISYIDIYIK